MLENLLFLSCGQAGREPFLGEMNVCGLQRLMKGSNADRSLCNVRNSKKDVYGYSGFQNMRKWVVPHS